MTGDGSTLAPPWSHGEGDNEGKGGGQADGEGEEEGVEESVEEGEEEGVGESQDLAGWSARTTTMDNNNG